MNASANHEAYLRAALHAAADSLEPQDDGLERIRARLQHARPRAVSWLLAAGDAVRLRTPAALQDALYRLNAGLWTVWERFAPAPAPGKHRSRTQGLLRPLAAMAVVVFIVAAGTYVAIDVSTAVSPSSSSSHPRTGPTGPAGHPASSPSSSPTASGAGPVTHRPSASPTCSPTTTPQPSGSPSPSPSPTPTPTPTATPTPTPTATTEASTAPDAVSAVRLTAFMTVASAAAPTVPQDACGTQPTSTVTPESSTSYAVSQSPAGRRHRAVS